MDEALLREALELATHSVAEGGGPFGALVVRDGVVVGRGTNRVVPDRDPTAHAEVVAIRSACQALQSHELSGCVLYASCEPCPLCLAAAHWARIEEVVHAATRDDAAAAGFDDALLHAELARPAAERSLRLRQALHDEARGPFDAWRAQPDRVPY